MFYILKLFRKPEYKLVGQLRRTNRLTRQIVVVASKLAGMVSHPRARRLGTGPGSMVIKWFFFSILPFWLLPDVQIFSFSSFSLLILGLWFSFGVSFLRLFSFLCACL
jgi:hypothetical protein